jgi:hypothetical protein
MFIEEGGPQYNKRGLSLFLPHHPLIIHTTSRLSQPQRCYPLSQPPSFLDLPLTMFQSISSRPVGHSRLEPCTLCALPLGDASPVEVDGGQWHAQCFRCAECYRAPKSPADVFIVGGAPVCKGCAYLCDGCRLPLEGDTVLSANSTIYHAVCFRCVKCEYAIDDPTYAVTTLGNMCPSCHHGPSTSTYFRLTQ